MEVEQLPVQHKEHNGKVEVFNANLHKELFDRLRTDRDGLVAYNSGLIADKLEALADSSIHAQEEIQEHE
jgi:hypothetical protein